MHACMCVCMCVCTCVYVCVHVCMYTCCHACVHAHAYIFRVKALGFMVSYLTHNAKLMHTCMQCLHAVGGYMYLYMHTCMYALATNKLSLKWLFLSFPYLFVWQNSTRVCRDEWFHCRRSAAPCAPRLSAFAPRKKWALPGGAAKLWLCSWHAFYQQWTRSDLNGHVYVCLMSALVCQDTLTRVRLCTTATRHEPLMSGLTWTVDVWLL